MLRELVLLHMPGYMLRHHQTGHPVMGEIAPRRTAPITGCPIWYDGIRKPGMRIHCALSAAPQQFKQA